MRLSSLLAVTILLAASPALAGDGTGAPAPATAGAQQPGQKIGTFSGLDGEGLRKDDDQMSSTYIGGGMGTPTGTSGVANGTEPSATRIGGTQAEGATASTAQVDGTLAGGTTPGAGQTGGTQSKP